MSTSQDSWPVTKGVVVAGHGVASGRSDSPFGGGTIALQRPHFAARGLDLSGMHPGTLNVDFSPGRLVLRRPRLTLTDVDWTTVHPPESFSFVDVRLWLGEEGPADAAIAALLYHPHPETKPMHHQPGGVVEVLAPFVSGAVVGAAVTLAVDPRQAAIEP